MSDDGVRAIARGIAVLQAANRHGALNVQGFASATGLPHATVTRIVRTLVEEGFLERGERERVYRPSALAFTLSCGFAGPGHLIAAARTHLVELTRKTRWPVTLAIHVGSRMEIADSTHTLTSQAYSKFLPQHSLPLLLTGLGQAYLAYLPAQARRTILRTLPMVVPDADPLLIESLDGGDLQRRIVAEGFARAGAVRADAAAGQTSAISVPIFEKGAPCAALSISFFTTALSMDEAIAALVPGLKAAATAITAALDGS